MSAIDVHRLIDSKLPAGRVCSEVRVVEVYTAVIDGAEISVDAAFDGAGYSMHPEQVADLIVAQLGSVDNAQPEGGEAEPEPQFMRAQIERSQSEEADDEPEDDLDYDPEPEPEPAPKRKKKAKAKKHR